MTFEEMLHDPELFIPHHLLELVYSSDELIQMNRYYNVPSNELIWIRASTHWSNPILHKAHKTHTEEHTNKIRKALKGNKACGMSRLGKPTTEFGRKYKEHYGLNAADNRSLYEIEHQWYRRHNNVCRWEM